MRIVHAVTALVVMELAGPALARSGAPATLFAEGNRLYRQAAAHGGEEQVELYRRAARTFARAADSVQNAYLLYNLGNARYRAGEWGRAIAAYRRAELLRPRMGPLAKNLALARERAPGGAPAPKPHPAAAAFFFWHYALSLSEAEGLCAAFYLVCMAALSVRLFVRGRGRQWARTAAIVAGALAFTLMVSSAAKLASGRRDDAVVVSKETSVRSEPAARAVELYVLREGAEVRVITRDHEWTRVQLGDGARGWVETQTLERLADPPYAGGDGTRAGPAPG
jgi:tetratricopeptide (TPR) repeat protein